MPQIVQAHAFESGLPTRLRPERQLHRAGPRGIDQRRKDIRASRPGLAREDGLGRRIQEDRPRPGFAVAQSEHVTIDIGPAQAQRARPSGIRSGVAGE